GRKIRNEAERPKALKFRPRLSERLIVVSCDMLPATPVNECEDQFEVILARGCSGAVPEPRWDPVAQTIRLAIFGSSSIEDSGLSAEVCGGASPVRKRKQV